MKDEKGAAIVMVLLLLGVLSLLGAGLMVQSRYDMKFNRAQGNFDKMLNLADGATTVALTQVGFRRPGEYLGETAYSEAYKNNETGMGKWVAGLVYLGNTTEPQDMAGWELNEGYYKQFWIAQGVGIRSPGVADPNITAQKAITVQVPASKVTNQ